MNTQGRLARSSPPGAVNIGFLLPVAVATLLYAWVYDETLGTTEIFGFGFYTLHAIDIPIMLFAVFCGANLARITQTRSIALTLFLVSALIINVNFIRGMASGATASALLQARFFLALAFVPASAILCRDPDAVLRACRKYAIQTGVLLVLLVMIRLVTRADLFIITSVSAEDLNDGGRGVSAQGAMGIVMAFWLTFCRSPGEALPNPYRLYALRTFLLVGLVLSRQGTVGIATIMTITLYAFLSYRPTRTLGAIVLPILLVLLYVIVPILIGNVLGADFLEKRSANVETRQIVWSTFLDLFSGQPLSIRLLGWPFGTMPDLVMLWKGKIVLWQHNLHSMYFGSLRIMGYSSLFFFYLPTLWVTAYLFTRFLKTDNKTYFAATLMLLASFVIFYSYEANCEIAFDFFWPFLIMRSALNPLRARTLAGGPEDETEPAAAPGPAMRRR